MSNRMPIRICAAVCSAGLAIAALAGCGNPVPTVKVSSDGPTPVLTQAQEEKIRQRILQTLQQADEAKNPETLKQVLSGPELEVRTSQLTIAQKTNKIDSHSVIPTDTSQVVITTTASWPRAIFTITTTTDDQQSQRLLVLRQDNARSNYTLWGLVRLLQGAKMPAFEIPTIGSAAATADDKGLVATPKEAVQQYADVLQNGDTSKYAKNFDDDQFRKDLQTLTQTVQQGIEANKGTQTQTFTPTDDMQVMRSADGGDLVVARIDSEWVRNAGEGRESLPASDSEKALFGDAKATSSMKVSYVNVLALYVPKDGSNQKIRVVGAERQVTAVVAQ